MAAANPGMNGNGNGASPSLFMVAGEVSGDQNAARLAEAIRRLAPNVRMFGAGGSAMSNAGVDVQVRTADLHFMGLPASPMALYRQVSAYLRVLAKIVKLHPDLVIFIDNESTNLFLAKRLKRRGIPVVFFFPPQVWFWGRWRIPRVVRLARLIMSAFNDEANIYRAAGADALWVGHPLRDTVKIDENPAAVLRSVGLDPSRPIVALMPGSRRGEVQNLIGVMLDTAKLLKQRDESLQFVLPIASEAVRGFIEPVAANCGLRDLYVYRPTSYAILSQARVILQCSGTASLEAALLGIPSVIAYRCNPLVYFVGRRMMHVPFISITNLLLGEMTQPEFFYQNVDPEHLADAVWELLTDEQKRREIKARLARIQDLLGASGVCNRAAKAVLDALPVNSIRADRPPADKDESRASVK